MVLACVSTAKELVPSLAPKKDSLVSTAIKSASSATIRSCAYGARVVETASSAKDRAGSKLQTDTLPDHPPVG